MKKIALSEAKDDLSNLRTTGSITGSRTTLDSSPVWKQPARACVWAAE
jgi:hypothetical protein